MATHALSVRTEDRPTKSKNLHHRGRNDSRGTSGSRSPAHLSVRVIVLALILLSPVAVFTTAPGGAAGPPESACPEMTDSIRRLYQAIFLREPDLNEAFHWTDRYRSGEANLAAIANELIRSPEFERQHGSKTSSEFVELAYNNTRQPPPSQLVRRHWVRVLNTGYTRGEMILVLIESEDFVRKTATMRPLSGYLRWYPPGTHWYCGRGTVEGLSIRPLTGARVFADRLIRNEGDASDQVIMVTLEEGLANAVMAQATLPPRVIDYSWMGMLTGDGFYGAAITVGAAPSTRWIVVFYTAPIGHSRLGWQIDRSLLASTTGP